MIDNFEEKLKRMGVETTQAILLPQEKEAMKANLLRFLEENPEPANTTQLPAKAQYQSLPSLYISNVLTFLSTKPALRYAAFATVFLVIGSAGIATAAQQALPGDFLYPIKTGVNEKVMALSMFSNQAKAEYDITLARLRLEEAGTKAQQNTLTDQSSKEVTHLLSGHLLDVQARITKIKSQEGAQSAKEISDKLQQVLTSHAYILGELQEHTKTKGKTK